MPFTCEECGRFTLSLKDKKCRECAARQAETREEAPYFAKLHFVADCCARLVPAT